MKLTAKQIEKKIELWKEMFSYFAKLLVLDASAVIVDMKTRGTLSLIDILGIGFFYILAILSLFALYRWNYYIHSLRE